MKKIILYFFFSFIIPICFSQKQVQIGGKQVTIKGESTYGCFVADLSEGKPVVYEVQYYVDVAGKNLTYTIYWANVNGSVKATIYTCQISQLNLDLQSIKISAANETNPNKGEWNLRIDALSGKYVKTQEYSKTEKATKGLQNYIEIKLANKEKAEALYNQLVTIKN